LRSSKERLSSWLKEDLLISSQSKSFTQDKIHSSQDLYHTDDFPTTPPPFPLSSMTSSTAKEKLERINQNSLIEGLHSQFSLKKRNHLFNNESLHLAHFKKINPYIMPFWQGKSLPSKKIFQIYNVLKILLGELEQDLLEKKLTSRMYQYLYHDFFIYCESLQIVLHDVSDVKSFQLAMEKKPLSKEFKDFFQIYSAKVIMLYFLQLRIIKSIEKKIDFTYQKKDLISPPLLFAKFFPLSSQRELQSPAFSVHSYSWYRPPEKHVDLLEQLFQLSHQLNFQECMRIFNQLTKTESESESESESVQYKEYALLKNQFNLSPLQITINKNHPSEKKLSKKKTSFSHSLSHLGTGLLLNQLQLNFPLWSKQSSGNYQGKFATNTQTKYLGKIPLCKSTLYLGDCLNELAMSHWLAQENNKDFTWTTLLCPQFDKPIDNFKSYESISQELHFLALIIDLQDHYSTPVLDFLPTIYKSLKESSKREHGPQKSLFELDEFQEEGKATYDQIVLGLLETPKNNGHYFLSQKIMQSLEYLKDDGYIYVFSTQNLFLPSQREKVEILLKKIKVQAIFNFEDLRGKGNLPHFLYVLSKNTISQQEDHTHSNTISTCATFRFSGELNSFQYFSLISETLQHFFKKFLNQVPTIYQTNPHPQFQMEFFTDAIINGTLIHSSASQGNQITHPSFFKKMMKNCLPFDFFFDAQSVESKSLINELENQVHDKQTSLLFEENNLNDYKNGVVLVFDLRIKDSPKLELIPTALMKAKAYEYGVIECLYFILRMKQPHINYNILKSYFESPLGLQVIQLSLKGNYSQLKSKLSTLLIPTCIKDQVTMPPNWSIKHHYLSMSEEHFAQKSNLEQIELGLSQLEKDMESINTAQIGTLLSQLCLFQSTLKNNLKRYLWEKEHLKEFDFNTPFIHEKFKDMVLSPIYPSHPDIKIEFEVSDLSLLNTQLSHHKCKLDLFRGEIELYNKDMKLITIYTSTYLIVFLNFLLKQIPMMSIKNLLNTLNIPSNENISRILALKEEQVKYWSQWENKSLKYIDKAFTQFINS